MYIFLSILLGVVAHGWLLLAFKAARGLSRLPVLSKTEPLPDGSCPRVSILFTARDEAEKLPEALATLLAQDYPGYEVIAVNDRSTDGTGNILDELAAKDTRLKVVHLSELPPGWLGKSHALTKAYEKSTGEWLVFTDADVRFAPGLLRRALRVAQEKRLDHLTAFVLLDTEGFWEKTALSYFGLGFVLSQKPWENENPRSKSYVGIGAFQLIRRSTYEAVGTHRRLAMEVVEDMKLCKLVKQGGFRSSTALAEDLLCIRWKDGLGDFVRGLTKNTFAVFGYRTGLALLNVLLVILCSVLPFALLPLVSGLPLIFSGMAVTIILAAHGAAAYRNRISPLFALTHPLGALILAYVVLRSLVVTLWQGGIYWRDTFYPLADLRKGMV